MDAEFLKLIEQGATPRPVAYNRRWHLDEDDRRHHGRRQWDPQALEEIVRLAAAIDSLYPPDWSDENAVRFRAKGIVHPLAEVLTDSPDHLRLVFPGGEVMITTAAQVIQVPLAARLTAALRR